MARAAPPSAPLLLCPQCGRSQILHNNSELPRGLQRMLATCPDCEGHGQAPSVLEFEDGRIEFDDGHTGHHTRRALPRHPMIASI